jgi:hypothetical protein
MQGIPSISDIDLMDKGKGVVMNRCETLIGHKLLEEQSLRVSIRDLREFKVTEKCANIVCIQCRYLELVRQNYQRKNWSTSMQERNTRQKAWSKIRRRQHLIRGLILGKIWINQYF